MAFTVPTAMADDEVSYPLAGVATASPGASLGAAPSPLSPRALGLRSDVLSSRAAPDQEAPPFCSREPTEALPEYRPDIASRESAVHQVYQGNMANVAMMQQGPQADMLASPDAPQAAAAHAVHNFDYYAQHEYHPVLRPPTSICSSSINTAVRAAPWEKWMTNGKLQTPGSKPLPTNVPEEPAPPLSAQTQVEPELV